MILMAGRLKGISVHINGEKGFTFTELALVLALIGVIAAIAVPNLAKCVGRYRLQCTARELLADLRWAQQAVINREYLEYRIVFDPVNERYLIYDRGSTLLPPAKTVYIPPGVDLYGTNFPWHTLTLNLKGLPVAAGTVELVDRVSGCRMYVIIHPRGRSRIDTVKPSNAFEY